MLEELSIRNFAIVDQLAIHFAPGFNILTGETGAGKSILIGALGFLLGTKADTGLIRSGADECVVSAVLDVSGNPDALAWLAEREIQPDDGSLLLRRSLKSSGRGTIHIQNEPAVRQDLADLGALLLELHGQRDGLVLLRRDRQRLILDRFAGIEDVVQEYGLAYSHLASRRKDLELMTSSASERAREAEFLRFAIEEIDAARVKPGEDAELADEERRLTQHEKLSTALTVARDLLGDSDGVVTRLRRTRSQLEAAAGIDNRLADAAKRIDDAFYEIEDLAEVLRLHADQLSFDPARLEAIESRLAVLQKLKRKYGPELADILRYRDEGQARLQHLENWAEDRQSLIQELDALEKDLQVRAGLLTAARSRAVGDLSCTVAAILARLGMPSARFAVRLERRPMVDGKLAVGPYGAEEPEFLVTTNKGEPLKPLADVASGGELSRVMLAIKTILAKADGVPSLVFDEIDAGIGGEVAIGVAGHLADLALTKQVLCITHLASIAVRADNHIKVEKRMEGDRTVTGIKALSGDERIREVARMLSGDADSSSSIAHAADLIRKFGRVH
jgi:DNA repair protein RecN (Recombination protein N)